MLTATPHPNGGWRMTGRKTTAAVLLEPNGRWEIRELDLDPPKEREVLVRVMATGLCHSDEHVRSSLTWTVLPLVGGHEGAGIVEAVGPGVTRVAKGDHIVTSFIPVCGRCRYCSTGRQNLCDDGKNAQTGRCSTTRTASTWTGRTRAGCASWARSRS